MRTRHQKRCRSSARVAHTSRADYCSIYFKPKQHHCRILLISHSTSVIHESLHDDHLDQQEPRRDVLRDRLDDAQRRLHSSPPKTFITKV